MASAMNSGKGEVALEGLVVSSNLTKKLVWSVVGGEFPSKGVDPVLSSDGWDSTISVSRVVEHSDFTLEFLVNPLRSLWLDDIIDFFSAEVPGLNVIGDMKSLSNCIQVEVVEETRSIGAWWKLSKHLVVFSHWSFEPWSVVVLCEASLLFVGLIEVWFVQLWVRSRSPASAKDIIDVDIGNHVVELIEVSNALIGGLCHLWAGEIALS